MSISSSHGPVTHELLLPVESTADQGKKRRSVKTKFCAFCKISLPGIGKGVRHIQDGKVGRKQASIRIDSIHDNGLFITYVGKDKNAYVVNNDRTN